MKGSVELLRDGMCASKRCRGTSSWIDWDCVVVVPVTES